MEENKKMNRKNYFCNDEINNLVKLYSQSMGISESAFINICITNYHKQEMAMKTMGNLEVLLNRIEQLENKDTE